MNLSLLLLIAVKLIYCDERSGRVRRIVGGEPAVPPPEDEPVVFTRFGGKTARVLGVRDFPHYVFRGIRYGLAPTGKERFLRPRQYFLQGLENATQFPPPCVQPVPGEDKVTGKEDCLFLNVFTPSLPTGMEGLPVIVWIHGGGFRYGSASQYGVRQLVGKQVVVVTIQYRLGSLGFLSTGTKTLPGNAGLWDMVLAVTWTRNYIGFFGGNPNNIVVMGHGTGASSAIMVALSNVAKGLASGIVAMSGSSLSQFATDDAPANTAMDVAEANGCPVGSELTMVRCLQNLSPAAIIKVDSVIEATRLQNRGFVSGLAGKLGSAPVFEGRRDGRSLPPVAEVEPVNDPESTQKKIPLLTGITKDETKRACHGQFRDEITNKLQKVPEFLDKVLVKNLQNAIGINRDKNSTSGKLLNLLDPNQFKNYLQYKRNNLHEGLAKIAEATADALFNAPAFLTADAWSKHGAPAFLYRFEHVGKRRKGYNFLKGLPLVGNHSQSDDVSNDTVAHGDELSYIFDAQDMEGKSLESDTGNEEDNKVRDIFTQMISDFARHGKLSVEGKHVKPFSITDNNFVQISPKPKVSNGFRYCEMGLWLGLAQRLQSSTCELFKVLDTQLKNIDLGGGTKKIGETITGIVKGGGSKKPPDVISKSAGLLSGNKDKKVFGIGG
nr:PREDICTED: carboxylesterase 1E [Tribolium castaneum]|eukprot:XP_969988.2 PREDICTED: carboxylesterase 1E [Tribolium castaneum]